MHRFARYRVTHWWDKLMVNILDYLLMAVSLKLKVRLRRTSMLPSTSGIAVRIKASKYVCW